MLWSEMQDIYHRLDFFIHLAFLGFSHSFFKIYGLVIYFKTFYSCITKKIWTKYEGLENNIDISDLKADLIVIKYFTMGKQEFP